jgi:hypothetical protein
MTDPIDRPYFPAQEPSAQQQGVDAPGFFSSTSDFMNGGVYNGTFRIGPPQSASNIDVASSLIGSNFVPGWRFVQSSNTAITGLHQRNTASPSGSNFRFVYASGAASDEAFIEQLIDITGTAVKATDAYRLTVLPTGQDWPVELRVQYLTVDGAITGGEGVITGTPTAGTKKSIVLVADPPTNAKYARLRALTARGGGISTSATGSVDVLEVKRDRPATQVSVTDQSDPDTYTPGYMYQYSGDVVVRTTGSGSVVHNYTTYPAGTGHASSSSGGDINANGWINIHGFYDNGQAEKYTFTNSTGGSNLLLGWSIMPIYLSRTNVGANVTNARLAFPTEAAGPQFFGIPFPTHLVGITIAHNGTITAGNVVVDITSGLTGTVIINDLCTFTSTSATEFRFTYEVGEHQFAAGVSPGIAITSTGLAPTTVDFAAILFLATPVTGGL